ncbi:MAG: hypothetical protein EXR77_13535 [Myxococcales bacterium]|nr:hypothetical protein [Myxococcales bacterium]
MAAALLALPRRPIRTCVVLVISLIALACAKSAPITAPSSVATAANLVAPPAPAAAIAAPAPATATTEAADANSVTVEPPVVLRLSIGSADLATGHCAARVGTALWVAARGAAGAIEVHEITPIGRVAVVGGTDMAKPQTAAKRADADSLVCIGAGSTLWVAPYQGDRITVVQRGAQRSLVTRGAVTGAVGQTDGTAVIAVTAAAASVDLARLNGEFQPLWQRSVTLPGELTAVSATLRDDAILVGKTSGQARDQWWLMRVAGKDGTQAWTQLLDPKTVPPRALFTGIAPTHDGVVLAFESTALAKDQAKTGWLLVPVDANGKAAAPKVVQQRSPTLILAGSDATTIWAQARGNGLVIGQVGTGAAWAEVAAPWPTTETPLALAVATDGAWWALSRASHADDSPASVLVSRFSARPTVSTSTRDPTCVATLTRADATREPMLAALGNQAPCGPRAQCRDGQCRPAGK